MKFNWDTNWTQTSKVEFGVKKRAAFDKKSTLWKRICFVALWEPVAQKTQHGQWWMDSTKYLIGCKCSAGSQKSKKAQSLRWTTSANTSWSFWTTFKACYNVCLLQQGCIYFTISHLAIAKIWNLPGEPKRLHITKNQHQLTNKLLFKKINK